jgi:ATP-dependent DNA helicase PIF1
MQQSVCSRGNDLLQEEMDYPQSTIEHGEGNLTQSQRAVTEAVLNAVANAPRLFVLQGPGGTGKTFVENNLLAKIRSLGKIALAVASSRIAAILLSGGRTAHSRFKLPVKNVTANITLNVSKQSTLAELFRKTELIIWDEAPMQHRHCAEAVSRCFPGVRYDPRPFGGVTVLFCRRLGSDASHNQPKKGGRYS